MVEGGKNAVVVKSADELNLGSGFLGFLAVGGGTGHDGCKDW